MNPSVLALENQYMLLRGSLSDITAAGASEDQLNALRTAIATSRDNYWKATRSILHDDDPEVASLVSQLNFEQITLDHSLKQLDNVAKVLDDITKAVDIGSQIVAKATVL